MPNAYAPETALVTGAGGFLGGAIARLLSARGDTVKSISRGDYPGLAQIGITHFRADLSDLDAVKRACEGCDTVYHVAAKAGIWGRHADFVRANVIATENVIEACRAAAVKHLVYTSSPSVVFAPEHQLNLDESAPYPETFLNHYTATKAEAERLVKAENGAGLFTVALRPHLIVGEGDPHLIPRLIQRAKRGQLAIVGNGDNLVDMTWVDDAARAHLQAAEVLRKAGENAPCAGKAYFITQGEPVNLWDWINDLLRRVDVPPVKRRISYPTARRVGAVLESLFGLFRLSAEPRMTRFLAGQLAMSHTYSIAAAARDFGYAPRLTMGQVTDRLVGLITGRSTDDAGLVGGPKTVHSGGAELEPMHQQPS